MKTIFIFIIVFAFSMSAYAGVIQNKTIVTGEDACLLFKAMEFDVDNDPWDEIIPTFNKIHIENSSELKKSLELEGVEFAISEDSFVEGANTILEGSYADLNCKALSKDDEILWAVCTIPSNWGFDIFWKLKSELISHEPPRFNPPIYDRLTSYNHKFIGSLHFNANYEYFSNKKKEDKIAYKLSIK